MLCFLLVLFGWDLFGHAALVGFAALRLAGVRLAGLLWLNFASPGSLRGSSLGRVAQEIKTQVAHSPVARGAPEHATLYLVCASH